MNESVKRKIATYSVFVNLFLSVLKISTGLLSGSKALVADGIHSVSDLAASLSVLAGIFISSLRVKGFPYGIYKVENFVSIASAFAIFFAGYEIMREVFISGKGMEIVNIWIAVFGVVLTIAITFLFSRYEYRRGKELSSPSLIADSKHVRADMFSAAVVLAGIIGNYFGFPVAEKVAVVIVCAFIFKSGFEILLDSVKVLLDVSIDRETLERIRELMESHPMVEVKSIIGRNSGSYKFVEADIGVSTNDLSAAHRIAHEIEAEVLKDIPSIEKIVIHFEPEKPERVNVAVLTDDEKHISYEFGKCRKLYIFSVDMRKQKILGRKVIENPFLELKRGRGIELVEFLSTKRVNCLILSSLPGSKGVMYALSGKGIDLVLTDIEEIEEIERAFLKGKLSCEPATVVWNRSVCNISGGEVEGR